LLQLANDAASGKNLAGPGRTLSAKISPSKKWWTTIYNLYLKLAAERGLRL
jgi:hypothetical protein